MNKGRKYDRSDWSVMLSRIKSELAALTESNRAWLVERITRIETLQYSLDELFHKSGGMVTCAGCDGSCCGCGRHHFTLTNLLAYLLAGEEPPPPDFSCTCPYLGDNGCRLPVARRPYNCITFFCERLEERLDEDDCARLRSLDRELRMEYQRIADRYPGASLRGLWIAVEQVGNGQILGQTEQVVIE